MADVLQLKQTVTSPVYVCTGSDCRKRAKGLRSITEQLGDVEICAVKCQKICKGPVIGVEVQGRLVWFSKLKDTKLQKQFMHLIQTGELKKRLRSRISLHRTAKLRGHRMVKPSQAA